MAAALAEHLPGTSFATVAGASSFWLRFADHVDTRVIADAAARLGVLIEPGDVFFAEIAGGPIPANYARLGFASIEASRIEPGIATLATACAQVAALA